MSKFASWTTQSAFALTLNKVAIGSILAMKAMEDQGRQHHIWSRMTLGYLSRRGLVEEAGDSCRLTKPGRLMAELLIEAGFTYEKFNIDPTSEVIGVDKSGVLNVPSSPPCDLPPPELRLKTPEEIAASRREFQAAW